MLVSDAQIPDRPRFFDIDHEVLEAAFDWSRRRILEGDDPETGASPAPVLDEALAGSVCSDGIGGTEALRRFADTIVTATRAQGEPMNLAYVPGAPTPASLICDLAVGTAEIFAGTWEAGAGAIHAENQALRWLADLAGFPDEAGGTFVQGGTVGNLSALSAGRERARHQGATPQRWAIAATNAAHSSVAAAARTLDCDVILVEGDDRGRMTGAGLEQALAAEDHPGVFAVVATAGTTNAGIIDDLAGIADVCAARGLWMHVDGAYGLAGMAAPSIRARYNGIEQADSFIVDPHKWLFAPYDCCALVYRHPAWGALAHSQHASYLDHLDRTEWNPADYAIQLTRRARGLPFWFSLATYGTAKYSDAVEQGLSITQEIAARIDAAPHLELLIKPELSVVLFKRVDWPADQMLEWSEHHRVNGTMLCVPTSWLGQSVFRLCIINPDTDADRVMEMLDTMR